MPALTPRRLTTKNGTIPLYRPLKVYAFDPTRGRSLGNCMVLQVNYEQSRVTVDQQVKPGEKITLPGTEVVDVLRSLYTGADRRLTVDARTVLEWLREKPSPWQQLASSLKVPGQALRRTGP
jgi:hypothetical protein